MRLHTTTVGDGPHRVGLVHGLGADGDTWRPLVERMLRTDRFTVTSLDLRGHGRSERAASYRLDDFADDVSAALPIDLDAVIGHSLGGSVLVRAVDRLKPRRAIYLDPGFALALPTTGVARRLFWAVPALSMGVAGALQARKGAKTRAGYDPEIRRLLDRARERFDARMAVGVFRDVAFHPVAVSAPAVPSTIVLSGDSPAVLPDAVAARLEQEGWQIRRLPGLHHDMHLEDADRTFDTIVDLL